MTIIGVLSAIAGRAARRPRAVLVGVALLALVGAALALRLNPSAATDSFVGRSSGAYKATQRFYENFGEEPIEVLVKGNLQQLVLSSDLERLIGLEGCLSGRVPSKALGSEGGANGPCGELAKARTVKVVLGPGTFINEAAEEISKQLESQQAQAQASAKQSERVLVKAALARGLGAAEAHTLGREASKVILRRFAEQVTILGLQYGLNSAPSLTNPNFVERVVFDSTKRAGTPKERFAYLFPSRNASLISVRLRAGLSESERSRAIELIRRAVRMPQWHLTHGESYLVTGEPVIVADLTGSISHSLKLLLIAVLLVMAVSLSLIFRSRPRLLPLVIALLATAVTFGALSVVGASLTVAEVAVLPALIGLAVDYAIQFQSRVQEAMADGAPTPLAAVNSAVLAGVPAIATAAVASAAAMLVLALSPVPTVRGFGALLVAGIVIAFLAALSAGSAALVLANASGTRAVGRMSVPHGTRLPELGAALSGAWLGARELLTDNPVNRFISRTALVQAARNPRRVLVIAAALAALGWGLDTQTKVQTDITKLVPSGLSSLKGLNELERASGVGGEIDLMVSARDLTKPSVIGWMSSYQQRILSRFHYSATSGCGKAQLCPAFSLPDLLQGSQSTATAPAGNSTKPSPVSHSKSGSHAGGSGATELTQASVRGLLNAIPPYFSQEVISPSRRLATLAFGIRLMPLSEQQRVIEAMRAQLHPPKGVHAQLVGLAVLAAQSGAQVASVPRRMLTLIIALIAVMLVLVIAFRGDRSRVFVAVLPVALASGWSALVLFAIRVPLNPLSVTLGALVIAISTEFSVLLCERHRQERLAGYSVTEALSRSYQRTGGAVAASGVTAIAGFGVLALSDIRMLRDFGLVTLVDLSVSLIGVLVVLPSALTLAERGEFEHPVRRLARRLSMRRSGSGRLRPGRRHEPV